ncbi:twin-arginine translocation signal domain-containing protein [Thalassoglobus sp. JC818]|uniref:twin-arginine translocation signal domain-containing protein n=1 Tax=Thalassoglobus sp. JC818 TaxID=3232136 RepID=UPI003459AF7C
MTQKANRRKFLKTSAVYGVAAAASGCGTILYPERMGQRRGTIDDVDWTIVGMDAIGLVFFFVPGAIAFAIDFQNGTMFYPSQQQYAANEKPQLKQVSLPEKNPSVSMVEHAVAEETGEQVSLVEGNFVSRRLKSIKEFWTAKRQASSSSAPQTPAPETTEENS